METHTITGASVSTKLECIISNAFIDSLNPLTSGNPAATCLLLSPSSPTLTDKDCQSIATAVGLSETCFIRPMDKDLSGGAVFSIRWFTPSNEVDLCGHATLASANAMFSSLPSLAGHARIQFQTVRSGTLTVERAEGGQRLAMNFPANISIEVKTEDWTEVLETVLAPTGLMSAVVEVLLSPETKKLLVVLHPARVRVSDFKSLAPDISKLKSSHDGSVIKGVVLTMRSLDSSVDFLTRYFAPWNGIDEDPVNGSSHTILAPFWKSKLNIADRQLVSLACSPRGGVLWVDHFPKEGRVALCGVSAIVRTDLINLEGPST